MTLRPALRRALSVALVGAALLFLGLAIADNLDDLGRVRWDPDPLRLAASIVAHVAVLGWGVVVWQQVLRSFEGGRVRLMQLQRIWFLSGVARYIPGKIWQFVAVADLARRADLSRALILTSMLVHVGFTLLAAVVVGAATLPLTAPGVAPAPVPATALALAMAILASHPVVLNRALRLVPQRLRGDVLVWRGRWRDSLVLLGLNAFSWLIYGGALYLFFSSLFELQAGAAVPLAGVNSLAFVAGYIVVLAPAGLGVRELTMARLLEPLVPLGAAAVLAGLARLWTIAAELLGAALVLLPLRGGEDVA